MNEPDALAMLKSFKETVDEKGKAEEETKATEET